MSALFGLSILVDSFFSFSWRWLGGLHTGQKLMHLVVSQRVHKDDGTVFFFKVLWRLLDVSIIILRYTVSIQCVNILYEDN